MTYEMADWRNDPGINSTDVYKKKFALFPTKCADGTSVWLKYYYVKYTYWGYKSFIVAIGKLDHELHRDKIENVSEADYIVRKLTGDI